MHQSNSTKIGSTVPRTSPDRGKARLLDLPDGFVDSYTACFGYNVHAVSAGPSEPEGFPILMIHGAVVSRRYLLPTAELLCAKYQVHVVDLVGHGSSSKPEHALTVPEQAAVLAEFLKQKNINRVYVLANSYGCEIAVHLSANYPELVDRLIIIGPTCDRSWPTLLMQFLRLCADGIYEHPSMTLVIMKDLWELGLRRAIETSKIMLNYRTLTQVPKVVCKTLVVRGSNDPIANEEWTHRVVRAFNADVTYIPVQGAPHNVNYTNAPILYTLVDNFLHNRPVTRTERAA